MADADVLRVIDRINRKIAALVETRSNLMEQFGIEPKAIDGVAVPESKVVKQRSAATVPAAAGSSRKTAVANLLRERGPMLRADIVASAGIPEGTVSYCLNDKRYFRRLEDGRWDIVDRPQPELALAG